jgi:hypothetical protein
MDLNLATIFIKLSLFINNSISTIRDTNKLDLSNDEINYLTNINTNNKLDSKK